MVTLYAPGGGSPGHPGRKLDDGAEILNSIGARRRTGYGARASFCLAVGVLVLITTRWNRWESNARMQTTDDAYLQADLTPIAAKVSGYVRAMPVQDFERVHAGQLLVQIVDDDYRAAVDQLTASVLAAARYDRGIQGATRPCKART